MKCRQAEWSMASIVSGSAVADLHRYFAFGSNMNPARVLARGLDTIAIRSARLDGVRLTFDKVAADRPGVGHASLTFAPGGTVEGVLYDLAGVTEILKMDAFERTPINYSRELVTVRVGEAHVVAWTYYANAAVLRPGLRPSRDYLAHLLAGRPYLSERYVAWLASVPCSDG